MKLLLLTVLTILTTTTACFAQTSTPNRGVKWEVPFAYLPSPTATNVTTKSIFLDYVWLSNTSASTVTCTFVDRTTNCNGSACQFYPAITIAANSVYSITFGSAANPGIVLATGFQWSCTTGNVIAGYASGAYTSAN